ncbi:putative dynein heavy chain [Leptomonas pyrrhocoris]|uniref:Putative dynein heavy chain n=1 Tax=Leptomonas pyrrhocoris TaxID=157538 RepID=A0A0M9FU13_LEPPY|nr:putative dynein heavy chain [Leptomonas pyrrhocoris]KPA75846.1 putative dynein heavy chain [Leptomonas pyrrhocoris]|eukprot:XP_015654285.1 putative dynein heavy chain [Leptomonas pyrrhocoris]
MSYHSWLLLGSLFKRLRGKSCLRLGAGVGEGEPSTEDCILAIFSTKGNILESEGAIEELDSSKEQSDRIAKRQEEIEAMERISDRTRNMFIPAAHLGAILFFCVTELANIDPMYQNSLQSYMSIFQEALMNSAKSRWKSAPRPSTPPSSAVCTSEFAGPSSREISCSSPSPCRSRSTVWTRRCCAGC